MQNTLGKRRAAGQTRKAPPFAILPASAARDTRLCEAHFRTLIALSSYANWKDLEATGLGDTFAHMTTIAREHGIPLSTLSRTTRDLETWGYLVIEKRRRRRGGRPSNLYLMRREVALPADQDRSATNSNKHETSEAMEVSTSTAAEVRTSTTAEIPISVGRKFSSEQTNGSDQHSTIQIEHTKSFSERDGGAVRRRAQPQLTLEQVHERDPRVFDRIGEEKTSDGALIDRVIASLRDWHGGEAHGESFWRRMFERRLKDEIAMGGQFVPKGEGIDPSLEMTPKDRAAAIMIGLGDECVDEYWREFRAEMHKATGAKALSTNWPECWRRWCMRKLESRSAVD